MEEEGEGGRRREEGEGGRRLIKRPNLEGECGDVIKNKVRPTQTMSAWTCSFIHIVDPRSAASTNAEAHRRRDAARHREQGTVPMRQPNPLKKKGESMDSNVHGTISIHYIIHSTGNECCNPNNGIFRLIRRCSANSCNYSAKLQPYSADLLHHSFN